ncbi:MAG: hypothetical protein ACRAVC_02525 [Trichormus sp.]
MPNAPCPMPNAPCPMPNAQCPIPLTLFINFQAVKPENDTWKFSKNFVN